MNIPPRKHPPTYMPSRMKGPDLTLYSDIVSAILFVLSILGAAYGLGVWAITQDAIEPDTPEAVALMELVESMGPLTGPASLKYVDSRCISADGLICIEKIPVGDIMPGPNYRIRDGRTISPKFDSIINPLFYNQTL